MTVLLDTTAGINNEAFKFWIENYGLNYVDIDSDGNVYTISNYSIQYSEELEAKAKFIMQS